MFVSSAFATPLHAQDSAARSPARAADRPRPAGALPIASIAGQTVTVLPITMVTAEPALKRDSLYAKYRDRAFALAWADSTVGAALVERGPEVQWVLPPQLRHLARRSPGMVKDPDTYGQAIVRSSRYKDKNKELPEPLRGNLRNLVAVAGGRFALVPAALVLDRGADSAAIRATLTLVLTDARAGRVLWRTAASGQGATPDAALDAALATALPLDSPSP
jgi:hypothetical protein